MENKKTFFASLEPKSALVVGMITGVLALGTIGFIVMAVVSFGGKSENKSATTTAQTSGAKTTAVTATVTKSAKPKAELFIMSYCPYGLQMEKAYLPVMELLKSKADMDIKFVSYAMHGKKEIDENTRQYCIQSEQNSKFLAYLKCFTAKDDYQTCLKTAVVDETKMNSCISQTDKKYNITAKYNDQSSWLSGKYPIYPVHEDLNTKYDVQGSPTLIINGTAVSTARTPEAVKKAVCDSFTTAPSECNTTLSTASAVAGFGTGAGTDTAGADCGS